MSYEIVGAIHAHTTASDGRATFPAIVNAARRAGLDFLITTDHNTLPPGEAGYRDGVLLIVGQEVHDIHREPQVNHLLCIGVHEDVTRFAPTPQALVDAVNAQGGLAFIAHPHEVAPAYTHEPAIPWVDWDVRGVHGLEIWNYMSEFKAHATSLWRGAQLAYWPTSVIVGPFTETLTKWDELLRTQRVVAIGGPDAHGWTVQHGPIRTTILPYPFLFRAVRCHLLADQPLTGDFNGDRATVLRALRGGRLFVAYDAIGDARGFRFTAQGDSATVDMGEGLRLGGGVRLTVESPRSATLRLLRDGAVIAQASGKTLRYQAYQPGVYRVEATRRHWFKPRGWVFTNPIYVEA